ncbi:hypothetical protein B0H66DRAFT_632999, partial [Apodospora peruviana]
SISIIELLRHSIRDICDISITPSKTRTADTRNFTKQDNRAGNGPNLFAMHQPLHLTTPIHPKLAGYLGNPMIQGGTFPNKPLSRAKQTWYSQFQPCCLDHRKEEHEVQTYLSKLFPALLFNLLRYFVEQQNFVIVLLLLRSGVSLVSPDRSSSLLHVVASQGQVSMLALLLGSYTSDESPHPHWSLHKNRPWIKEAQDILANPSAYNFNFTVMNVAFINLHDDGTLSQIVSLLAGSAKNLIGEGALVNEKVRILHSQLNSMGYLQSELMSPLEYALTPPHNPLPNPEKTNFFRSTALQLIYHGADSSRMCLVPWNSSAVE